jgi:hypothetical protein
LLQELNDAEWPERKANFNKESWQSQLWSRFPNSAIGGSTPLRGQSFASAAYSSPPAAPASPHHAASMTQLVSVLRNIHGELAALNTSCRSITHYITSKGVTRDRMKQVLETLQNSNAEEGEAGLIHSTVVHWVEPLDSDDEVWRSIHSSYIFFYVLFLAADDDMDVVKSRDGRARHAAAAAAVAPPARTAAPKRKILSSSSSDDDSDDEDDVQADEAAATPPDHLDGLAAELGKSRKAEDKKKAAAAAAAKRRRPPALVSRKRPATIPPAAASASAAAASK